MSSLAALLAAIAALSCAACTPTRSSLRPPYEVDGHQYDETQIRALAAERCEAAKAPPPEHPFTTDGCSVWPDRAWGSCCIEHDVSYWCGGTTGQRKQADEDLRSCVRELQHPFNAQTMYLGVRFWAHRLWPFPWRWGYGHDWPFRADNPEEARSIASPR